LAGLTSKEAIERLKKFGYNTLPKGEESNIIIIFLRQFLSPIIYILLAAAIVSLFLEQIGDAIFIFAVLAINAIIGATQEYSAQRAAQSLQKMVSETASVIRDGKIIHINTEEIVPDDLMLLESGDKVSADIKLLKASNLYIDESLLTGESAAVLKNSETDIDNDSPISDRVDTVFAGTMVVRGRGRGVVKKTGLDTVLGKIAKSLLSKQLSKPPLLLRIEKFTMNISVAMMILILLLFASAFYRGENMIEIFLLAVALAVAAIPEGLPAAITVVLAVGMRRMANHNVITRKLMAVESLGSCTFIASDKTGTLTVNELTARYVVLPNGVSFNVTGEGVNTTGEILPIDSNDNNNYVNHIDKLCSAAILANEAIIENGKYKGDMVDIAFLVLGKKHGYSRDELLKKYPEICCTPYESENGYSASINDVDGADKIFVKGSTEKLLDMCSHMSSENKVIPIDVEEIEKQMVKLAEQGYRVIALAEGSGRELSNLTFLGLVGMIDPLRPEAKEAVDLCKKAGIEVAMITGDHPVTAHSIACELGLCSRKSYVVTGQDIRDAESDGYIALDRLIENNRVFARIEPTQKKEIVESLMRQGHFVAVTGDGVNDAPALKHSHVGIAMGKRGTDVARESADMILTDDNFSSIVQGVEEGRIVYANIRKVILLLIATGAAEIILFILSMLAGLPMPLLAVQLLWLNLVTNGFQHIALSFEPAEGNELNQPPRSPNEPIFNRLMIERVLVSAVVMGIMAFLTFQYLYNSGYSLEMARNGTLMLMVLFENIHAINSRSEKTSIFKQPFFSNPLLLGSIILAQTIHIGAIYTPWLGDVLQLHIISIEQWSMLLIIASSLIAVEELHKLVIGRRKG